MNKIARQVAASVLTAALVLSFAGCNKNNKENNVQDNEVTTEDSSNKGEDKNNAQAIASEEELSLYDELFDLNSTVKISIDIADEELKKIQEDYRKYDHSKSPIYRKCDMTFNINGKDYKIEDVGIRMKGNTSRNDFYSDSQGVYNLIHFKISFDETFDDEKYYGDEAVKWENEEERNKRKERTFASLSGLEMKWNREEDSTYLRETYCFKMYRDMGCYAPNNTIGQCVVNNENWGVFKIYEPVDKVFIERNFEEQDQGGDLYKCSWGAGPANYTSAYNAGVEDEDNNEFYTYDLKTNKKTSQHEALKDLINTATRQTVTKEDMERVLDRDNFVKFCAISYFLGMPDDMRNNYNNHYVYFKKSNNKAVFIAYDCDLSLGINQWNPTRTYMTSTDPYSDMAYGANERSQNQIICKTITKDGLFVNDYKEALDSVTQSKWMTFDNFKEMFDIVSPHYSAVTQPERHFSNVNMEKFDMTIDDTYGSDNKSNHNYKVEKYMERMLKNYSQYENGPK